MLTNFLYNGKNIQIVENLELKKLLTKSKNRIWIKASNITQEEKIILKEIFNIHPTTIEYISTRHTMKKYEDYIAHYILDKEVDRDLNIKIEFGDVLKQIERKFIEEHDREILKNIFSKELVFLEFRQLMESITDVR